MSADSSQSAKDIYRVRISKGFVDERYGEGFLVEVWDYRVQRIIYSERFKDLERARKREKEIKADLENLPPEKFEQVYQPRRKR